MMELMSLYKEEETRAHSLALSLSPIFMCRPGKTLQLWEVNVLFQTHHWRPLVRAAQIHKYNNQNVFLGGTLTNRTSGYTTHSWEINKGPAWVEIQENTWILGEKSETQVTILRRVRDNVGVWVFLKCQAIRHLRCFSKSLPLGSLPSLPLVSPWKFSNLVHIVYPALSTGFGACSFLVPTDSQGEQKQETPVHSSHRGRNKPLQCLWHFLLSLLIVISNPGKWLASSSHLTDKKTEAQKG